MISIIIPFHNEEENLLPLHDELQRGLQPVQEPYEVLLVDDGSTDKGLEIAHNIAAQDNRVRVIEHPKQMGKGQSLHDGIEAAHGELIVFMDADLQDDPSDLPRFLAKIREGADFVNGIRAKRKDTSIIRIYSRLANRFLRIFLHSPFRDINCGYKMFRRKVLNDFVLYGNNFRFLPLAAYYKGFRVDQVEVNNRPRLHGVTKYGAKKLLTGIFDTVTAYFLYRFSEQPLHFFGLISAAFFIPGFIITLILTIERLFFNVLLYRRPSLLYGILLIIVGIQIGMTGIIGELIVYQHKKSRSRLRS